VKTPDDILKDAKKAKEKDTLAAHEETIRTLRAKKFSWRDIAKFLSDRGVETDHSKVFRFFQKLGSVQMDTANEFIVPTAAQYVDALTAIDDRISDLQRKMLETHFRSHNRTATFGEIAKGAGHDKHTVANLHYGKLAATLAEYLGMTLLPLSETNPEKPFYCSAIGTAKKRKDNDWNLIMHHELGKALETLKWFK
jgi:hypothetical protein